MPDVSIIIPSRNEQFLTNTIKDLLAKAKGDIEVIAMLEAYWPDEIVDDPRVIYQKSGKPRGLRGAGRAGVDIATGKFVLKVDAHCMFGEGYDVILAADCEEDWVVVPRRKRLDAENWKPIEDGRPDIDYMYLSYPVDITDGKTPGFHGRVWKEKNADESLKDDLIVDLMSAQGSCWFMHRDYVHALELFDDANYGTFANEFQEIGFKAWLSGGRVIRNKKTWYAHLHKGQQYGRGYSLSKATVAQANAHTKKWATNDAWDKWKVKRDLKWYIDHFSPVPEWEDHDWDEWGVWDSEYQEPEKPKRLTTAYKVKETKPKKRVRVYQNIVLDGVDVGENAKKKDSKFWNEGKWHNFIEPLLPTNCEGQTFVDMGCNAGLFLRLAKERGYSRVLGVDKSRSTCQVAEEYRDSLGLDYKILHRTVGVNFDFDEIPVADVTLLSTVHYYFDIGDWLAYLDKLRWKTRYCLVVSRSVDPDRHWCPSGEIANIRNYFRDWTEVGAITDVPERGDPHPRTLWSLLFKSDLVRMPVDSIYIKNQRHRTWVETYKRMDKAKRELAAALAENDVVDLEKTSYFGEWLKRKEGDRRWPKDKIKEFVQGKADLMLDVKRNGLKEPLIVKMFGQICDGGHRLAILRALGHKDAIVRLV
jgi:glycosyltransferase involved in cell wall biosynthesis